MPHTHIRPMAADEFDPANLDPGIRDLVVYLRGLGIPTCDSGDGVSKERDEGSVFDAPHVFAWYDGAQGWAAAMAAAEAVGRVLSNRVGTSIEVSWSPRTPHIAVLAIIGYTNEDVPR